MKESKPGWRARDARSLFVRDLPWTIAKLKAIPPSSSRTGASSHWAAIPTKGPGGRYGHRRALIPVGTEAGGTRTIMFAGDWFQFQVKQMEKVGRPDIDQFRGRHGPRGTPKSFVVAFGFSSGLPSTKPQAFRSAQRRIIKLITVQDILGRQQLAQKM